MRRIITLIAMLAAAASFGPGTAQAASGNYCTDVLIDSGNTCIHGNSHTITTVYGRSTGSAVACVGLRYGPSVSNTISNGSWCSNPGALVTSPYITCTGNAKWPYIRNGSSFLSRFRGSFDYFYCP